MTDYFIEPYDLIDKEHKERVRAIKTLMEELDATMLYEQRIAACQDENLKGVLIHNRDEEIEHCAMTLEWLRRDNPTWNEELKTYLWSEGPISEVEEKAEGNSASNDKEGSDSLGIGDLK